VVRDVNASGYEWLLANSLVASHLSAYGTLQTLIPTMSMSASGGKADIPAPPSNVR
jgi:hypothetical protein